jgi:hypothetical protein
MLEKLQDLLAFGVLSRDNRPEVDKPRFILSSDVFSTGDIGHRCDPRRNGTNLPPASRTPANRNLN